MQKVKIGVVGLGGIGGLCAILLKNAGYEVFSNQNSKREKTLLKLSSKYYGNLSATININKTLNNTDIIFICSKFPYLKKIIKNINNNNAIIVPFLNGLSHFDILKKKFKKNLYYSNIGKIISIKKSAKKILHLSKNKPEILISSENKNNNKIRIICNIFKKINFNVKVINSNTKVVWTKLIRLSSISAITAIYNCNLGEIKKSKKKMEQLENLVKEGLYLAKLLFNFKESFNNIIQEIIKLPNSLTTSLQRDINNKITTKSEIETQIGAIYKLGIKNRLSLKNTNYIYKLLKKNAKKNIRNNWA
jgi:2-dehydropantoate 2-reductase